MAHRHILAYVSSVAAGCPARPQLEEAIATGGDLLHVAAVFGVSEGTAIRYATNARILLQSPPRPRH